MSTFSHTTAFQCVVLVVLDTWTQFCLFVVMGCTPTKQYSTEVTETSQEDAQKIVERVYSAKQGA